MSWKNLAPPPDFSNFHSTNTKTPAKAAAAAATSYAALKERRAWDLAISPAKSLPMQAFMLYMSGGGVQIFSMGIVLMLLLTPIKNIASMNAAFSPFMPTTTTTSSSSTTLSLQKLTYILCNILTLVVGLWKCRSMGLLPTGTGDWLAFETRGVSFSFPSLLASGDIALVNRMIQALLDPPISPLRAPEHAAAENRGHHERLTGLEIHPEPHAILYY
ncbi:hypothetical protein J3R83DRAFT_1602 [Lanmaoa asiatica]|nr:hypothetical protein J3R83DRAFT_1602 [Lanmaoa asiatica]